MSLELTDLWSSVLDNDLIRHYSRRFHQSSATVYDSPQRSLHCWRSALMELTSTSISNMTMTSRPPDVIMTSHRARDTMTLIIRHHRSNGDWTFTSHGRVFTSERSVALTRVAWWRDRLPSESVKRCNRSAIVRVAVPWQLWRNC